MAFMTVIVAVVILLVGAVTAYSSVRIVGDGEVEALVMFGETRAVLHPGLNFVPPFISKTYPVDARTMTMDRGRKQVGVPEEFEREIREVAEFSNKTANHTETDAVTPSTRQRAATVFGRALFVLGAFGFAVPMVMLGHIFERDRWAVSGLFAEATLWQAVLAAVAALFVMLVGESIGREYGTWGEE